MDDKNKQFVEHCYYDLLRLNDLLLLNLLLTLTHVAAFFLYVYISLSWFASNTQTKDIDRHTENSSMLGEVNAN